MALTHDQKLRRNKMAAKLHKRTGRDYVECLRVAAAIAEGRKPKPRRRAPAVSEAAARAVDSVVRETLAKAQRSSAPATRAVHELDEGGLAEAIGTAAAEGMVSPFWTAQETAPPPPPAQPAPPADTPLHEMDWETGDAVMAAGLAAYGRQAGLASPFWAGSGG